MKGADEINKSEYVVDEVLTKIKRGEIDRKLKKEKYIKYTLVLVLILFFVSMHFFVETGIKPNLKNVYIPKTKKHEDGRVEVIIEQDKFGHYIFSGKINGEQVKFLLDTGATYVSVPESVAIYLGLVKGESYYSNTANGKSLSYSTILKTIEVGGLKKSNISGSISTGMEGDEILLGMSFLNDLELLQKGKVIKLSNLPN